MEKVLWKLLRPKIALFKVIRGDKGKDTSKITGMKTIEFGMFKLHRLVYCGVNICLDSGTWAAENKTTMDSRVPTPFLSRCPCSFNKSIQLSLIIF